MPASHRRVVITGMGIMTTLGESIPDFFEAVLQGRSGISCWKQPLDPGNYSKIGGDLSDFDLAVHLSRFSALYPAEVSRRFTRLLQSAPLAARLTAAAALQAFIDAGLLTSDFNPERAGHIVGGTNVTNNYLYDNTLNYREEPEYIDPLMGLYGLDTDVLAATSELLNLRGTSFTVGAACASGNMALLTGLDIIRAGRADVILVSGSPFDFDPVTLQSWAMIGAMAFKSFNDHPTKASRPFATGREGFVPSHAAGVVVLESLEHARARNAVIHAEICGAAATSSATRSSRPDVVAQCRAMHGALEDAGLAADKIDYLNAHATSTPLGDAAEVNAIKSVFGAHAYHMPVNATKSMLGHSLTASGVVEIITTVLQLQHNVLHPTINQENPDQELDLDFVAEGARDYPMQIAASNSFGFGGLNSCVIMSKL